MPFLFLHLSRATTYQPQNLTAAVLLLEALCIKIVSQRQDHYLIILRAITAIIQQMDISATDCVLRE